MIDRTAITDNVAGYGSIRRITVVGVRYGIATAGPLSVSVSNFLASLALLRVLSAADFGLFAFVLVVVQFSFSLSNALLATPFAVAANRPEFRADDARIFLKANLLFSISTGVVCWGIAYGMKGGEVPPLFGLFGAIATMRWFARAHAYAVHKPLRVAVIDAGYSATLLAGLVLAWFLGNLEFRAVILAFAIASAVSLVLSGPSYLKAQLFSLSGGHLRDYLEIWRNQARWALLGVASAEATANAYAYIITAVSGTAAFAPIAAAAVLVKPISLLANALSQIELPTMARAIARGNTGVALQTVRRFRWLLLSLSFGTLPILGAIFLWFPAHVLNASYDVMSVASATALWALIGATRAWRTPESVFLQGAGQFRDLALNSLRSSPVSLVISLLLLLLFSPSVSLAGVLAGEIVLALGIAVLMSRWKSAQNTPLMTV